MKSLIASTAPFRPELDIYIFLFSVAKAGTAGDQREADLCNEVSKRI
jgi:hypothetical protein